MSPGCRFCESERLRVVLSLGSSPLANAYVSEAQLADCETYYPLDLKVCEDCFLAQLAALVNPESIFRDYAYSSSWSTTWLAHAKTYVDVMVDRLRLGPDSCVVEIGSNDGYLLQYFAQQNVPVLGIEPAANVAAEAVKKGVPTRVAFWNSEYAGRLVAEGYAADLILGNNVLAHVPELNDFVAGIRVLLKPRGVVTMEFPHLYRLIEGNQFDTIYHEHYSYFSFFVVEKIFAANGLTVFDVEELTTHGGSLRIHVRHAEDDSRPVHDRVDALAAMERKVGMASVDYYLRFAEQVQDVKRGLREFLVGARRKGKRVVGYGAPAKGNTLLNYCGIRTDLLEYTVDRNPMKQGMYTPGARIPIRSPEVVRHDRPDYLLILPWNLAPEIVEQMHFIREWGGRFVVPIPQLSILDC